MRNRSTAEVIVLILTVMVSLAILLIGVGIVILELQDPTVDTSAGVQALSGLVSTVLGALLGLLMARAGKNS